MSTTTLVAIIASVVSLAALVVLIARWPSVPVTRLLRQSARRSQQAAKRAAAKSSESSSKRRTSGPLDSVMSKYRNEGIEPPSRITVLLISLVVGLGAIILATVAGWSVIAAGVVALIAWSGIMYLDFSRRRARRKVQFEAELPDFLMTLSSSLKAGLTLDQAMAELTRDSATVLGQEFARARREVSLGKTWQDALLPLAERMKSVDIRNLVDGLALAHETGSSLTSILEAIAESCLERAQLKREIKTLTAEGMLSAYVIIALPFIIFLFLLFTQPSYVAVLWQPGLGLGIGIGAVVLIALGWVWLRRTIAAGSK